MTSWTIDTTNICFKNICLFILETEVLYLSTVCTAQVKDTNTTALEADSGYLLEEFECRSCACVSEVWAPAGGVLSPGQLPL